MSVNIPAGSTAARPILILAPSEWSDTAVSNMQIAAELSLARPVAYIETPGGRMPRWSELPRVFRRLRRILGGHRASPGRRGLDPRNVRILSPLAIPLHGHRLIDRANRALLLWQVRRFIGRLGIRQPVVWSFSPNWQPVAERLDASVRIFHCVDGLHTYDGSIAFRAKFDAAARAADVVFTPGIRLYEELRQLNPNTHRIGHGVAASHLDFVDGGVEPADLHGIPAPRVVYAGTLANWVDYDLLIEAATALPAVSFVLIGYVHALAPRDHVEALLALPNVFAVGYQSYDNLPAFYRRSTAAIVPYRADNEHIRYSTPTKFLDYLAAGLPIVSTRFPAAEELKDLVAIADNAAEFAAALESALDSASAGDGDRRHRFARDRSWAMQVARMMVHVEAACTKRCR